MNSIKIVLNSFDKVKEFIHVADNLSCNLQLSSGNLVVDGRSILGIFALDLSKAIDVSIVAERQDCIDYSKELEGFLTSGWLPQANNPV